MRFLKNGVWRELGLVAAVGGAAAVAVSLVVGALGIGGWEASTLRGAVTGALIGVWLWLVESHRH